MRMRIQYQNNENTDTAFRAPPAHTCGACLAVLVIVVMRGDRIGSRWFHFAYQVGRSLGIGSIALTLALISDGCISPKLGTESRITAKQLALGDISRVAGTE